LVGLFYELNWYIENTENGSQKEEHKTFLSDLTLALVYYPGF